MDKDTIEIIVLVSAIIAVVLGMLMIASSLIWLGFLLHPALGIFFVGLAITFFAALIISIIVGND